MLAYQLKESVFGREDFQKVLEYSYPDALIVVVDQLVKVFLAVCTHLIVIGTRNV